MESIIGRPGGAETRGEDRRDRLTRVLRERLDRRAWLVAPAAIFLLVIFGYPVFLLLMHSLSRPVWGLQNYAVLIRQPLYLHVLWNTVLISGSVTCLCLVFGYPMAYTMAHAGTRLRRLLVFAVLIPFWSSILVRTFAWMVLLQQKGLVNRVLIAIGAIDQPLALIYNRVGVLIGMVQILLPFMIFPLYSVLIRIEPNYSQAAASLGAPPVRNFLRIYFPLSLPGVINGCILVFVIGLGYYITPALLGGIRDVMIAQMIEKQVANFGNWGLAGALAVVLLLGTAVTFMLVYRTTATQRR